MFAGNCHVGKCRHQTEAVHPNQAAVYFNTVAITIIPLLLFSSNFFLLQGMLGVLCERVITFLVSEAIRIVIPPSKRIFS